jgi:hypothetical protein
MHSLTHTLTPRIRVLLENLIVPRLVKKFPAIYGIRRFITAFTRSRHPAETVSLTVRKSQIERV